VSKSISSGNLKTGSGYRASGKDLIGEIIVLIIAAGLIFFFGQKTRIMSISIVLIILARFLILNRKGDWIFFLLGLFLGGGNDLISMYKGVYYYLPGTFLSLPIPAWMLLFWGEIFIFFRKLCRFGPFIGELPGFRRLIDLPLALDFLVAIIYRMVIYRLASRSWLPDAIFAGILIIRLLLAPPKTNERKLMLTILILGPLYEIFLIRSGLYVYQTGVVFGMPLWLIVYWVFIIRFLKAVFDRVEFYLTPRRG